MGLKKYISFGLILLIAIGVAVYSFIGDSYSLSVAGVTITLPIAVWVVLPALLLFIFTLFHLLFYGAMGFTKMRGIKKDSELFLENSKNALLGKMVESNYKTDIFKLPGAILPLLNIDPKRYADHRVYDDGVQDILDVKRKLDDGEVVDLYPFSLRSDNALVLKNHENRLKQDKSYALTILNKCDDEGLKQKALLTLASYAPLEDINRYDVKPTKEIFDIFISRIGDKENPLDLSDEDIISFIKKLDFSSMDFIELAKKLKPKLNPDRLILLFEKLSCEFPNLAGEAYLYVMFELQMMDNAREYLDNSSEDEYLKFRYLLFLKDSGKNFDTELFV